MKSHTFHSNRTTMLVGALAAAALATHASQATTLQTTVSVSNERSFWDASVWIPAQTPGPGDTVRIGNVGPRLYLGDFAPFAAQSGQISRLHFDGTSALHVLDWRSKPAGGQAGGLRFSQDDPADFGVGIRVGRISGQSGSLVPSQNQVIFIDAENAAADAMNIRIGGGAFSNGDSREALQLFNSHPTTLHANDVILDSAGRTQLYIGGTILVANGLFVETGIDAAVIVDRSALTAKQASFANHGSGTSQVPLLVASGGSATIDNLRFQVSGASSASTIQIGTPAIAFESGGTASVGIASVFANGGGTAKLVVDGVGGAATSLTMKQFFGTTEGGGTLELRAINGGHLALSQATLSNSPSTPGQLNIVVDGAGSQLSGSAGSKLFPGSLDVVNGDVGFKFSNGGACIDCELNVAATGHAIISGDSTIDFTRIKLDGRDNSLGSTPARATMTRSLNTSAAPEVIAGSVNVDSDFVLFADGSKIGGDLNTAPTTGSRLNIEDGSHLRIGLDPASVEAPLLALGALGTVTIGPSSSAYIGDPLATASYVPGMMTLAAGGNLYGNGTINGSGFSAGFNPTVLNTGGTVHPGFSPGKLTIDGQYIQQDGELELEIAGSNPGEYDVLDASQGAQLRGGRIRIVLLNGFVGVNGTRFDFFGSSGLNFFDPRLTIMDETGLGLVFNFSTGAVTIGAPVPLPPMAPLFALECLALLVISRRRPTSRSPATN